MWLANTTVPGWMKPNKIGTILSYHDHGDDKISYIHASYAGKRIDATVLTWLMEMNKLYGVNISYDLDGSVFYFGTKEFTEFQASNKIHKPTN
jgi:hypothetical protein